MVQMTAGLNGGMPGGLPGGMPMPGGGMPNGGMPPTPGAANSFGASSPAQIQQKMLRQRQLALERRRIAGRHASGGMAQANQLPAVTEVQTKAPGWDRVLGEGIDKPGSLAEKAEQAFQQKKGPSVVGMKALHQMPTVDEKVEDNEQPAAVSSRSNHDLASKPKRASTKSGFDGDEIEICDVIDSVLLEPSSMNSRVQHPQHERGGPTGGAGWNLHVEHVPAAAPVADSVTAVSVNPNVSTSTAESGRKWYKPWSRAPKPAPAPAPAVQAQKKNTPEVSMVQAFDARGVSTPDSIPEMNGPTGASGMAWGGGAGGSRPRRRRASPQRTHSDDLDQDFMGEMMAPGAIHDSSSRAQAPMHKAQHTPVSSMPAGGRSSPVQAAAPYTTTSVQPLSTADGGPTSRQNESSHGKPFTRPRPTDDVTEVQAVSNIDEMSDFGDRPARPDRRHPNRDPGWSGQADRSGGEEMVRKRFWKPFGGSKPPPASTEEPTMVCAFGE